MARLGCLLMVVSMVLLFGIIVIPVLPFLDKNTAIDNYLTPILCQPGEKIERDLYSEPNREGGTSFSMNVYCLDREEQRRDESGRWMLIGGAAFTLPFVIGLFAFIAGVNRRVRTFTAAMPQTQFVIGGVSSGDTLTSKLREIEEARKAGLISSEEYDRLRKEILDEGV